MYRFTRIMSCAGMPSVMQTMSCTPASAASMIASAQNGAGTKMPLAVAPVARTAAFTVSNTGRSRCVMPLFPGVTPPTMFVPYSIASFAWKLALSPVNPWKMTRVDPLSRMLMIPSPSRAPVC